MATKVIYITECDNCDNTEDSRDRNLNCASELSWKSKLRLFGWRTYSDNTLCPDCKKKLS